MHTNVVLGLFVSLVILGLSAIDPVGIAAMPILLLQKKPFARSFMFLGGSFISLMVMGVLFALGLGAVVLHFEKSNTWFVPTIEAIAGLTLLGIAGFVFWRVRAGKPSVEPSEYMVKRLRLSSWQLLIFGALLVAFQSVVDVVFVIAMIRIGQLRLSIIMLVASVATYSIAALVLQLVVVAAYKLTPEKQRDKTLDRVHSLLTKYVNQALIGVSLLLGCVLLVMST